MTKKIIWVLMFMLLLIGNAMFSLATMNSDQQQVVNNLASEGIPYSVDGEYVYFVKDSVQYEMRIPSYENMVIRVI